jgi:hypothetical protein
LATDLEWAGKGVGAGLVKHALQRCIQAAGLVGPGLNPWFTPIPQNIVSKSLLRLMFLPVALPQSGVGKQWGSNRWR